MTFDEIFRSIHGYDPFPWQSEAARRLVEGEPFSAVKVPTASGKTAMIDIAVFAAAHGGPRRIAFIIDRRVVVDEAFTRAKRIMAALNEPHLKEFASKVGQIQVVRLRGGVFGDDDWVLYPDRLTIIVSTIDQVGSRLLHRGYGVGPRMVPLHAGFLGNDALFIVDEAHLSTPFIETVKAVQGYGADVQIISMTATPLENAQGVIELSQADKARPVLKKRLQAKKIAKLVSVEGKEDGFVKAAVEEAYSFTGSARVIGIVVNRVSTARSIWNALISDNKQAELLTGRIRPYDRDRLLEQILPEIRAGRVRKKGAPLFIVATQTIEVGADLDFDALITEAAPLDALRQRFGRLDRLGELRKSKATILYWPKFDPKKGEIDDPIYGTAIKDTWSWLKNVAKNGVVDFGISAIEKTIQKEEAPKAELKHGPTMLPAHIGLLAQTGPDAPFMDISPWLHGTQKGSADVSLIWRSDLTDNPDLWADIVRLRPPLTQEALEIPIYAARSWLEGLRVQEVTDLEGIQAYDNIREGSNRPALRWRGSDDCQLISPQEIRPGDTLILPMNYGGCDPYGWNPKNKEEVEDIADLCSVSGIKNPIIRLVPGLTGWLGEAEGIIRSAVDEVLAAETQVDPETGVDHERVEAAHNALRNHLSEVNHPFIRGLTDNYDIELHPLGLVLRGHSADGSEQKIRNKAAVELERHLEGVAMYAENLGNGHPAKDKIIAAALLHDLGKAEPRFQAMLYGNQLAAAIGPKLAKSKYRTLSERLAAYAVSGLPRGFRHELASLEYFKGKSPAELDILVRHLITTHHGYGRPWFPVCSDPSAPGADYAHLENGLGRSFSSLLDLFGPWKLAGMELILRSADIRQSLKEQE